MTTDPVLVRGVPGSPYTRKMVALLRYRRIAYRWLLGGQGTHRHLPAPKVELLPTLYFRDAQGEYEAAVDSTPIIRRLERMTAGRSVLPQDPVIAFLDELIEDFADEWVTKAMFHFRWQYAADIDHAGDILPRWSDISGSEARMRVRKNTIESRQVERLFVVGSNETTGPLIEESYHRLLALLSSSLERQPFLFGARPASADFALYGQLTQLAKFDPTPMSIALQDAPRVVAWVDVMDDLSGLEVDDGDWLPRAEAIAAVLPMLHEIGRTYVPVLLANAAAVASGAAEVTAEVEGLPWTQRPFPYQTRCLAWLRESRGRLAGAHRDALDEVLAGTGCEALFTPAAVALG